jgi:hypothetical protein
MQDKSIISKISETKAPDYLYHYTSAKGLIGIIDTGKIWATKIHYMNDGLELQQGLKYIREEIGIQKRNKTRSTQELIGMSRELKDIHDINTSVISFTSTTHDDLSQWRGYCKIGDGYSLCFDGKKLSESIKKVSESEKNKYCYLVPCKYEEGEHKDMLKELVSSTPIQRFNEEALLIVSMIKTKGFANEKEWRLVWGPNDYSCAKYRPGNFSIIPYWEFDIDLLNILESITIGPSPEQSLSKIAVEGLLIKAASKKGINWIPEVKKSELSWRSI